MTGKKETALDFFLQQISETLGFDEDVYEYVNKIFHEAKTIEKYQMVNFAEDYQDFYCYVDLDNQINYDKTATEYYNEIYGNG